MEGADDDPAPGVVAPVDPAVDPVPDVPEPVADEPVVPEPIVPDVLEPDVPDPAVVEPVELGLVLEPAAPVLFEPAVPLVPVDPVAPGVPVAPVVPEAVPDAGGVAGVDEPAVEPVLSELELVDPVAPVLEPEPEVPA